MKSNFIILFCFGFIILNTSNLFAQKNIEEVEEIVSEIRMHYNRCDFKEPEVIYYKAPNIDSTMVVGSNIYLNHFFAPGAGWVEQYVNDRKSLYLENILHKNNFAGIKIDIQEWVFYDSTSLEHSYYFDNILQQDTIGLGYKNSKLYNQSNHGLVFYYQYLSNMNKLERRVYCYNNEIIKVVLTENGKSRTYYEPFDGLSKDDYTIPPLPKESRKIWSQSIPLAKNFEAKSETKETLQFPYSNKEVDAIVNEIEIICKHRDDNPSEYYPGKPKSPLQSFGRSEESKLKYTLDYGDLEMSSESWVTPGCGRGYRTTISHYNFGSYDEAEGSGYDAIKGSVKFESDDSYGGCGAQYKLVKRYFADNLIYDNINDLKFNFKEHQEIKTLNSDGYNGQTVTEYFYKKKLIKRTETIVSEEITKEYYHPFVDYIIKDKD